jgi:predicted P-loop ATPase
MLVLEGAQGAGKSSAARILAGATYFSDSLPPMNTKDASDHIRGKWIIEIGELSAMQKSEIESTKAFISRQEEKFRPAYRRKEITFKRRCVFIGTTNQDTYLRDETGNRRFWPVVVGKIDLKVLKRDRDLLWAEALSRYRAGEKWYLTAAEDQLAQRVQRDRVSEDIWQSELAVALEDESEIAIRDAARRLGLLIENLNRTDQNRITSALKALGFVRQGKFTTGGYRNSARYVRQID